jgi:mono/diheme cytochrome c family protein
MRSKIVLATFLTMCGGVSAGSDAWAQASMSVWDGAYTDAQADRGRGQYLAHCSMCHGVTLGGNGEAPPLTGEFIPDWEGTTLDQLFEKISVTMPLSAPGTLKSDVNADILAFILKSNNFPSGSKDLVPGDGLKSISFDASKPMPMTKGKKSKSTK